MTASRPAASARWPLSVIALGVASFLTDVGSDMILPLLPLFLTVELHASASFVGLIEGVADTAQSFMKLWSGNRSDRARSRKPLVLIGYGIATVAKPLVAFATAPWHVLAVRLTDRVGKGIRTAPRDALLADIAPPGRDGRVFGFHRAMDNAGAIAGPLLASALLVAGLSLRNVFLAAAIPGVLSIVVLWWFLKEPSRHRAAQEKPLELGAPSALPPAFRRYLVAVGVFAFGHASDAFLLLRARELGVADGHIGLLFAALNASKVVCGLIGGRLADRLARGPLLATGWLVFALVFAGLALSSSHVAVWIWFVVYGIHFGLTEPTERALVNDLAPAHARGKAFGAYHFVVGMGALPAGALTGLLWDRFGPSSALATCAGLTFAAATLLLAWARPGRAATARSH